MVVGKRHVLHQNLAYNADTRLAKGLVNGEGVKGLHDPATDLFVAPRTVGLGERFNGDLLPVLMEGIGRPCFPFIGADTIEAAHKEIAVNDGFCRVQNKGGFQTKTLVGLHAVGVEGNDGNMSVARLFQGAADEAHIVAGAAAAAGLGHNDGKMIGIVFSRQHRVHDLSHNRDGGEAGIVVDEF